MIALFVFQLSTDLTENDSLLLLSTFTAHNVISFEFHLSEIFFFLHFSLFSFLFILITYSLANPILLWSWMKWWWETERERERRSKHNNKMKHEFYDINGQTIEQFTYPAVADRWRFRIESWGFWADIEWDMQFCDCVPLWMHTRSQKERKNSIV